MAFPIPTARLIKAVEVRLALRLVTVEKSVVSMAVEDGSQLPCQVGCVTRPGTHALSDERRRQVGGVACDEYSPRSKVAGHPGAEGVLDCP